jgi:hypothetical protein
MRNNVSEPVDRACIGSVLFERNVSSYKLNQALVRNVRIWPAMRREKAQAAQTAMPKVLMRRLGADCFVVAGKRGNARGAKGAGHRHLARVNRQREEPDVQWKAAAFALVL